jgi:hypothetical protein
MLALTVNTLVPLAWTTFVVASGAAGLLLLPWTDEELRHAEEALVRARAAFRARVGGPPPMSSGRAVSAPMHLDAPEHASGSARAA